MKFLHTFRGRLVLILALLLIATLGVQYYLNLLTQNENNELREAQGQTIVAAISVGFRSITSNDRIQDIIDAPDQTVLDDEARRRIMDIIIIDNEWNVTDSLNPDYLPTTDDTDRIVYKKLSELEGLPPLMEETRLGEDLQQFPNRRSSFEKLQADEAHAVPIETSQGRWYVMVLLQNDKNEARWRAARPLVFTLAILLISSLITLMLVWRFARPVADLSNAAREVAEGNLLIRVPDTGRTDEMGQLARNFNDMAAALEKARDLEVQLQQAEKSAVVGRLGSAIAHEIRNPLNYINLTLDHLRSKFAPEDAARRETFEKLTSQLKDEVRRINQQISDFLNYSRPATADLRPISVRHVIDDSLRLVEAGAAEKNIKISVVEHEDVPLIAGDPEFLRSVFNNLFINAVQAMENTGGHLRVKIRTEGPFVRIEITDTGCGISEENLTNIFEPYFSTKETGTGLGLAIVQKIVEVHNGSIDVESTEGHGTTFTVKLPSHLP